MFWNDRYYYYFRNRLGDFDYRNQYERVWNYNGEDPYDSRYWGPSHMGFYLPEVTEGLMTDLQDLHHLEPWLTQL